jgi:hypothetical protein
MNLWHEEHLREKNQSDERKRLSGSAAQHSEAQKLQHCPPVNSGEQQSRQSNIKDENKHIDNNNTHSSSVLLQQR